MDKKGVPFYMLLHLYQTQEGYYNHPSFLLEHESTLRKLLKLMEQFFMTGY